MHTLHSIKGRLRNSSGKPVADVIISIKNDSKAYNNGISVSDEKGDFIVSDIAIPGEYTLQFEHQNNKFTRVINIQSEFSIITINF